MSNTPDWLNDFSPEAINILKNQVALPGESVPQIFDRVASAFCDGDLELKSRLEGYMQKRWLGLSTPVITNGGTDRGFPVSCFSNVLGDDFDDIRTAVNEVAALSRAGGGTGAYLGYTRSPVKKSSKGFIPSGIMPFCKEMEAVINAYKQNSRRGSLAVYLPIDHPEAETFLKSRKIDGGGDERVKLHDVFPAACFTDEFMFAVAKNDKIDVVDPHSGPTGVKVSARHLWELFLKSRFTTGLPYALFSDAAQAGLNENNPGEKITHSNLCCITGSALIPTSLGLKTALELYELGVPYKVVGTTGPVDASPMYKISDSEEIYEIKLKNGMVHKVTANHKISTVDGLKEACELAVGDAVLLQCQKGVFAEGETHPLAFISGLWQGDGSYTNNQFRLEVYRGKTYCVEGEILKTLAAFHMSAEGKRLQNRPVSTPHFLNCKSVGNYERKTIHVAYLRKTGLFEKGEVPKLVLEGTQATQWEYLRGLFIADGTVSKNRVSLGSINLNFLSQVQMILVNLGVTTSLYRVTDSTTRAFPDGRGGKILRRCKAFYCLGLTGSLEEFEQNTRLGYYRNRQYSGNTKGAKHPPRVKKSQVASITKLPPEPVYSHQVFSEDHLYSCDGIMTKNSEIFLPTSTTKTKTCVLSSLNLSLWREWKDDPLFIQDCVEFLDNVNQVFIDQASKQKGFERPLNTAINDRSIGLGVLGWASLLQKEEIPFESPLAISLTHKIFSDFQKKVQAATEYLAEKKGPCPSWLKHKKGPAVRNLYSSAVAPTSRNATICGASPSIEPWAANMFIRNDSMGSQFIFNPELINYIKKYNLPETEILNYLIQNEGSVQGCPQMPEDGQKIFRTAYEIDQNWVIEQAAHRQKYINQGQSLNLFVNTNWYKFSDFAMLHYKAWQLGLKSLYYCRTKAARKVNLSEIRIGECISCE